MRIFTATLSLLLSTAYLLPAQTVPVTPGFGKVSEEEVKMTVYELDTTASAVMLYRKVDAGIRLDMDASFNQYITTYERWKILKEDGKDVADYELYYADTQKYHEKITNIKVVTHNLEANGTISHKQMSRNYLFDKKYTNTTHRVTFTAEDVRVGSVIEVTYEQILPTCDIDDIYLQSGSYPVNLCEVEVSYPEYFTYNAKRRGDGSLCDFRAEESPENVVFRGGRSENYTLKVDCYTAHDLPRLRRETACACPEQYRVAVTYAIQKFVIPGYVERYFATSWPQVDYQFQEARFTEQFKSRFKGMELLAATATGSEEEQITAVWNAVRESVTWNGRERVTAKEPAQTLKDRSGSSADINALLSSVLNAMGFTAEPVLLRPREKGDIDEVHISGDQFSTVILRVHTPSGKNYFLDAAGDESTYLNILEPRLLVEKARLMHLDGGGEWIDIAGSQKTGDNSDVQEVTLRLDPVSGHLLGTSQITARNQCVYSLLAKKERYDSEDEWIQSREHSENIDISSMTLEPDKPSDKVVLRYEFVKDLDRGGDYLYIPVFLNAKHLDGSFQAETRYLPLDYEYRDRTFYRLTLEVPEGYSVEQLPRAHNEFCSAARQSSFSLRSGQEGNRVVVQFNLNMNTTRIPASGYREFRTFWEKLGEAERSFIVLKKVQ